MINEIKKTKVNLYKNIITKTFILFFYLLLCFSVSGCTYSEIFNTTATVYRKKMLDASEYSMRIQYNHNSLPTVYVDCYYKEGIYAYRYSTNITHEIITYRELFIDNTHYRLLEAYLGIAGQYTHDSPVDPTSETNFVYKYTRQLLDNAVYTFLVKPEEVMLNGEWVTRFAQRYQGVDYEFYFSKEDLLVRFAMDDNGDKTILNYLNYKFENVSEKYFAKPQDMPGIYFKTKSLIIDILL